MGVMNVLCVEGDVTVEWDPNDAESVKKAKAEWARLKADGYEFFEPVEGKGKRLDRFSKNLGRVIAAPGVQSKQDKTQGTRTEAMAGGPKDMGSRR